MTEAHSTSPLPSAAACDLTARGWSLVPVPLGEKGPRIRDWQHMRIDTPELAAQKFTFPMNIGGILGPASGGRVDVDLDCEEACRLADSFLPITHSVFGRASKLRSHRIYRIN